jgi:hypothetical protein
MATLPIQQFTQNNISMLNEASSKDRTLINALEKKSSAMEVLGVFPSNNAKEYENYFLAGKPVAHLRMNDQGYRPSSVQVAKNKSGVYRFSSMFPVSYDDLETMDDKALQMVRDEFVVTMKDAMIDGLYYGARDTVTNQTGFKSLTELYSTITAQSDSNYFQYTASAGSSTPNANTSIWIIQPGEGNAHFFYDKTLKRKNAMGISEREVVDQRITDVNGHSHHGVEFQYDWDLGFNVGDARRCFRIANINVADLIAQSGTQNPQTSSTYVAQMIRRALAKMPGDSRKCVIFMNPLTAVQITLGMTAVTKSGDNNLNLYKQFSQGGIYGGWGLSGDFMFDNKTPVYIDEMIRLNEALIS